MTSDSWLISSDSASLVAEITELNLRIFKDAAYSQATVTQLADLWPTLVLLGKDQGQRSAGFAIGAIGQASTGWILLLGVREDFRQRSLGRLLMQELVQRMGQLGAASLRLTVSSDNLPAISLYESQSFSNELRIPNHFGDGKEKLVMSTVIENFRV